MGVQLTPGQRCLLEILQRKLLGTLQTYARLAQERRNLLHKIEADDHPEHNLDDGGGGGGGGGKLPIVHDHELIRLRKKIKRISARQKRFTSEIINGNGNNTIPKESFFRALGLVTKETLNQINSKSNERRRRTTANPRFSHEAIQAKRALQKPRVEPRVTREKRNAASAAAAAAAAAAADLARNNNNNNNNNINNNHSSNGKSSGNNAQPSQHHQQSQKSNTAATTTTNRDAAVGDVLKIGGNESVARAINRINTRQKNSPNQQLTEEDKSELFDELKVIHGLIETKAGQIRVKLQNKERLDEENKALANVIKKLCSINGAVLLEGLTDSQITNLSQVISPSSSSSSSASATSSSSSSSSSTSAASSSASSIASSASSASSSPQPPPSREEELLACQALASLIDHRDPSTLESPQLDTWLKCDESLDGLD